MMGANNISDPVKESPTIYDAFIEKEKRAQARLAAESGQSSPRAENGGHGVKKNIAPKKKMLPLDRKREPLLSLEEAVAKVIFHQFYKD